MKKTFGIVLLLLLLPFISLAAQEEDYYQESWEPAAQPVTVEPSAAPVEQASQGESPSAPAAPQVKAPQVNKDSAVSLVNKIIALIASIGGMFGQAAGFRIGGTTGTGIAALIGAKIAQDKAPSWVKWALYLTGGTMFAGGGANVIELAAKYIG